MPEMRRFEGRAALITGGGSGIGRAVAVRLASDESRWVSGPGIDVRREPI